MAEAVMEERSQVPTRFYCHMCNVEINIPNTDFTCPLCSGGFIEEIPANVPMPSSSTGVNANDGGNSERTGRDIREMHPFQGLDLVRGEIATLLMARNDPNAMILDPENRQNITFSNHADGRRSGSSNSTGGGRVRQQTYDRFDNVLMDFLQSISGDVATPFGNSQMFFMGNPGDYAWGREGIDTIVTQLLNQMETSGPPPLPKEKIDEIPTVEVTKDDIDKKLQCSVCWEDFILHENVRKLPCSHIYHEDCIVPWLDLHGTCPICRKPLYEEEDDNDESFDNNDANASGNAPNARTTSSNTNATNPTTNFSHNNRNAGGAAGVIRNSTAGATLLALTRNNQTPEDNNVFSFDDGNVDLD